MTATRPRLSSTVLRVAAVLSALAISSYLVMRTQRAAGNANPPSSGPEAPATKQEAGSPGLSTSKSLVIEPTPSLPEFSPFDPGLFSSKVLRIPSTGTDANGDEPTPAPAHPPVRDPGLHSSKSLRIPAPAPKPTEKQ